MHLKSERPSSPDQSTSSFFYKHPAELSPKEQKDITTDKVIEGGHEYTVTEKEPVVIADDRHIIRKVILCDTNPFLLEIILDEKVRQGKSGLIRATVSECNDVRERTQNLPPLALKITNDSHDFRVVRVKVLNQARRAEDFNLFFSLLVDEGYLSETTAKAVLSLLQKQTKSSELSSTPSSTSS